MEESTRNSNEKRTLPNKYLWLGTALLLIISLLFGIAAAVGSSGLPGDRPEKLRNVEVMEVTEKPYRETLQLPAKVEAETMVVLKSELSGRVEKWLVEEGRQVRRGEVVVQLDPESIKAEYDRAAAGLKAARSSVALSGKQLERSRLLLKQAEKELAVFESQNVSARASFALADKEYKRVRSLFKEEVVSESQVDAAEDRFVQARMKAETAKENADKALLTVEAARCAIEEAQAGLEVALSEKEAAQETLRSVEISLEKLRIKAPFDSRLDKHLVESGDVVAPDVALGVLYDLSCVHAVVDVADRYVPFLDQANTMVKEYISQAVSGARQDLKAELVLPGLTDLSGTVYGGVRLPASIERIGLSADPYSNTFQIELKACNPGEALKHGMIAQAVIDYLVYPDAITIPLAAVKVAETGPRVLVVEKKEGGEIASIRSISPVSVKDNMILVRNGLEPGDRLIVSGSKGIVHGQPVNVLIENGELVDEAGTSSLPEKRHESPKKRGTKVVSLETGNSDLK